MEFLKKVVMKRSRKIGLLLARGPVIEEGFIYFGWVHPSIVGCC